MRLAGIAVESAACQQGGGLDCRLLRHRLPGEGAFADTVPGVGFRGRCHGEAPKRADQWTQGSSIGLAGWARQRGGMLASLPFPLAPVPY